MNSHLRQLEIPTTTRDLDYERSVVDNIAIHLTALLCGIMSQCAFDYLQTRLTVRMVDGFAEGRFHVEFGSDPHITDGLGKSMLSIRVLSRLDRVLEEMGAEHKVKDVTKIGDRTFKATNPISREWLRQIASKQRALAEERGDSLQH